MDANLYSGAIGINNKTVPHRLPFDLETGVAALEEAVDVLVDRTGEIVTRRGMSLLESGVFHSGFKTSDGFYVVKDRNADSALYRAVVNADGTIALNGILADLPKGEKFSYTVIEDRTYFCNGYQHGYLNGDLFYDWPTNEWPGANESRVMITTPVGKHIDVLSGVIGVAVGKELFLTFYGLPGLVDKAHVRSFESQIIMVCACQLGWYISDLNAVYFITGTNPDEISMEKVLDYPAVEYGVNHGLIDPSYFGLETNRLSCLFATVNGPVIGLPDGTPINLINKSVSMPSNCGFSSGAIMVVDETTVLQSGE